MNGGDFLERMARRSRQRAQAARRRESERALLERALATPAPPRLQLSSFDIIAELKLRSPASGELQNQTFDKEHQILAYARGGACAVSVLTEPDEFRGSLADLGDAAAALHEFDVPAMRKDFLTEPYQLLEARAAGAGGALVIVTMLEDATVRELLACAFELGLFVLLEGFDAEDLGRIALLTEHADAENVLAGVNCRDLRDLQVDFGRFETLSAALPKHVRCVAESGVSGPDDVRTLPRLGYRLALVGSALMTAGAPEKTVREFIAAGRSSVAAGGTA
jgi:indole-3-glycerol phosphate synthase